MRSRATRFFRQWISCWLAGKKHGQNFQKSNGYNECSLWLPFVSQFCSVDVGCAVRVSLGADDVMSIWLHLLSPEANFL